MAQLIQFIVRRGPTVQTEMSLATAEIHCTICRRLSGATEDCSIAGAVSSERSVAKGAVCPRHYACSARCGTQSPLTSIGDKTM